MGTTWKGFEGFMLSEISQAEKKQISYDFTYMQNLKENNNNNKAKLIDTENRLVVAKNVGLGVSTWVLGYAVLSRSVVSNSCLFHGL